MISTKSIALDLSEYLLLKPILLSLLGGGQITNWEEIVQSPLNPYLKTEAPALFLRDLKEKLFNLDLVTTQDTVNFYCVTLTQKGENLAKLIKNGPEDWKIIAAIESIYANKIASAFVV